MAYHSGTVDPVPHAPWHHHEIDIETWAAEVRRSPADHGTLAMIVRRPAQGQREVLDRGELDLHVGLVGDNWLTRGSRTGPDNAADPEAQLNIINSRCALLVARQPERMQLCGDQLLVDLDLTAENLPPGTRLAIGGAVIEVTAKPHTGCAKFTARFGLAAQRAVNSQVGSALRMRGICAKVVTPGTIATGDAIRKVGVAAGLERGGGG